MGNERHVERLKKGAKHWNNWKQELEELVDLSESDLRHADLSEANLSLVNLRRADLTEANLNWANLSRADLTEADLNGANLGRADLDGANLEGADVCGADLRAADLRGANLREANLRGTNFSEAILGWTTFGNVDLSSAKGLDKVTHGGPSTIGIDTVYRSGGIISPVFLRGAGVPGNFIDYVRSLVGKPIEFYSCFISYSTKDQSFANRLHADLQARGVSCWFAPHKMSGGRKLHEQIDEAIRLYDRLLLILSEHSMESEWVKTEIAKARKREVQQKRRMLFPLRLVEFSFLRDWECFDADSGKDSALEIREYFIPDFSR